MYYRHSFIHLILNRFRCFPAIGLGCTIGFSSPISWTMCVLTPIHKNKQKTASIFQKLFSTENSSFLPLFPNIRTPNCKPKRSWMVQVSLECVCVGPLGHKKVCLLDVYRLEKCFVIIFDVVQSYGGVASELKSLAGGSCAHMRRARADWYGGDGFGQAFVVAFGMASTLHGFGGAWLMVMMAMSGGKRSWKRAL